MAYIIVMGKKAVSAYTHAQAVVLHQSGMNVSKISKQLNVSRECVVNAIERYNKYVW